MQKYGLYRQSLAGTAGRNQTVQCDQSGFCSVLYRQEQPANSSLLSVMEIQKLDEKRIRIIIKSYHVDTEQQKSYLTSFSGYTKQAKRIRVKDLDTQCQLKISTTKQQLEVRQLSTTCGNKHVRFSGFYQLQN